MEEGVPTVQLSRRRSWLRHVRRGQGGFPAEREIRQPRVLAEGLVLRPEGRVSRGGLREPQVHRCEAVPDAPAQFPVEPGMGFEPTTPALRKRCSAVELPRQDPR